MTEVIWTHPMNIEVSTAREGEVMPDGLTVEDEGALVLTVGDVLKIVMECPLDVMYILHEAREQLGDLILETDSGEED